MYRLFVWLRVLAAGLHTQIDRFYLSLGNVHWSDMDVTQSAISCLNTVGCIIMSNL